jgi:hypothetical protein
LSDIFIPVANTLKFEERIKDEDGLRCIDLTDVEIELFVCGGDAIAYVGENGQIERLVHIRDISKKDAEDVVVEALKHGDAWLGWCSMPQFCDPKRLNKISQFKRLLHMVYHA